jgi:hypothetical protein
MKNLSYIAVTLFLFSCGKRESDPVWDWGYLPASAIAQSKREQCAHKYYQAHPVSTDEGESLRIEKLPTSGRSHKHYLGSTCISASISTRVYLEEAHQKDNFYSISVELPVLDRRCLAKPKPAACKESSVSHSVLFSRDISSNELGEYFKGKQMDNIVQYDDSRKVVIFSLGAKNIEYTLTAF